MVETMAGRMVARWVDSTVALKVVRTAVHSADRSAETKAARTVVDLVASTAD